MTLEQYEKLREKKQFEPLWLDLLNASGYAGVLPSGGLVDRRYYPDAIPVQKNSMFGVLGPREVNPVKSERYFVQAWACDYGIWDADACKFIGSLIDTNREADLICEYLNKSNVLVIDL